MRKNMKQYLIFDLLFLDCAHFFDDLAKLLGVSCLVSSHRSKPIVIVQAAKDWMLNAVPPEIGVAAGFEEGDRVQALVGEAGQHRFPVVQQQRIERNRRLDAPSTPRDQRHGGAGPLAGC